MPIPSENLEFWKSEFKNGQYKVKKFICLIVWSAFNWGVILEVSTIYSTFFTLYFLYYQVIYFIHGTIIRSKQPPHLSLHLWLLHILMSWRLLKTICLSIGKVAFSEWPFCLVFSAAHSYITNTQSVLVGYKENVKSE